MLDRQHRYQATGRPEETAVLERALYLRRTLAVLCSVCALSLLGACEFLTGVSEPEELRVLIESDEVSSVKLVISPYFLQIPDPECPQVCEPRIQLVQADTTSEAMPFERIFDFTSRQQYFVEVFVEGEQSATVAMQILIDGTVWFDDFRRLQLVGEDGDQESLRFVYEFNKLVTP